jgi:hypothetical protein
MTQTKDINENKVMLYKSLPWVPIYLKENVRQGKKYYLTLFLPLINYKGLRKKWVVIGIKKSKDIVMSRLNNRYILYIEILKSQDNIYNLGIDKFNENKGYLSKNSFLGIIKDKNKVIKLFNQDLTINNSNYLGRKYVRKNILNENYNDLETRKMSNRLLLPHYYFTGRYIEKSMPPQIRSWSNSVYNFLKIEKSSIKHMDTYTGKLIKLFFNIKYIRLKKIWSSSLLNYYKIVPPVIIMKYMNKMIRYTSTRSTSSLSKISNYSSVILTMTWLKEQINYVSILNKYLKIRKTTLFGTYKPKLQSYYRKKKRVWLSNPIFKHTSYNLIIDLFVFNNKILTGGGRKFRKFSNLLLRRILYKYMYSMYVDYINKVRETLNRPRFFYINLIEPKIYNYYSNIVKAYEELLIINNKGKYIYLCMLILKWNNIRKNNIQDFKNKYMISQFNKFIANKSSFNSYLNNKYLLMKSYNLLYKKNEKLNINNNTGIMSKDIIGDIVKVNNNVDKIVFKRRIYKKILNSKKKKVLNLFTYKYIGINRKKKLIINMLNLNKKIFVLNKYDKDFIKKKALKLRKSKLLKDKKYFENLERKSNISVDLNKLTLWSRKGLGIKVINQKSIKIPKIYRHNKYSLEQFKRKIYYAKGKIKKKIAPNIWKAKLLNFYLLSKTQKQDTNPNRNIVNYKENELYKYVEDKSNNKRIYDSNFVLKKIKIKNDKILNFREFRKLKYKKENKKSESQLFKNKANLVDYTLNKKKEKILDKEYFIFNETMYKKKNYMKKFFYSKNGNNNINILNGLFSKFYILGKKKNKYINSKKKKSILYQLNNNLLFNINKDNIKSDIFINNLNLVSLQSRDNHNNHRLNGYNYNSFIKHSKDVNKRVINSKKIWDNLDHSVINILNNILISNIYKKNQLKVSSYNNLFYKINNLINNNDSLYLEIIKKEFYIVNRDVILSKVKHEIPVDLKNTTSSYIYSNNNIYNNIILKYNLDSNTNMDKKNNELDINIWSSYTGSNNRYKNIAFNKEYNVNIFKPYYKYMIPLYIYESYKSFMYFLGYKNLFNKNKISLFSNINWIKVNYLNIFNFVVVRTLLDLLRYNYRSLITVKPKYYYLNTVRYYGGKLRRLQLNTWIASVKYIKKLRKPPIYFWRRYNNLASFYYGRIVQSGKLDTKRKILLPFIFYFEDLLYMIYGKWAIMRLWPIKKYYLNSYILAERVMFTLVLRRKRWNAIKEYRKAAKKLIYVFKWYQMKKRYDYINEYNTRWPNNLINIMQDNKSGYYLNYNKLEFLNTKLEKDQMLSIYPIEYMYLKGYLSSVNSHYINTFYDYIKKLARSEDKFKLLDRIGIIKTRKYVKHWLKPLNTYIFNMKQGLDISGVRFRLGGRSAISSSNARRFKKFYFFGNLIGPRHYNKRTRKITSLTNPMLRNTIKSNIDYGYSTGINRNGCITLKVWLSSFFSSDVHELLLHLLRIKYLYYQLLNRYYLVPSKLNRLRYKWYKYSNQVRKGTIRIN